MGEFYPFFIVLFAAVFFSTVFRRFHVPWVIALILGGMAIGPHGLGIFSTNPTIDFLGQIGLVFLMFMAGLETKLSTFQSNKEKISILALVNGAVPFATGVTLGFLFNFDLVASLLLGIVFVSSSIAVILPSLESNKIFHFPIGKSIVAATILEDVASLVLFSVLLHSITPVTNLPLPLFFLLLLASLFVLRWLLPKLQWFFSSEHQGTEKLFQQDLRSVFAILIGTVIIFEVLGLHSIIAGFFAGIVLSGSIKSDVLKDKLRTIGYGLFIPTFFVIVGAKIDLLAFSNTDGLLFLTVAVVIGSMLSKFISGWAGGRIAGFTSTESSLFGVATMPQLSTTLAVVFTGVELGLLPEELVTVMVILSVVTVFVSPIFTSILSKKLTVIPYTKLTSPNQ
jgi:Kef-type K+ transport system membrane component KefB